VDKPSRLGTGCARRYLYLDRGRQGRTGGCEVTQRQPSGSGLTLSWRFPDCDARKKETEGETQWIGRKTPRNNKRGREGAGSAQDGTTRRGCARDERALTLGLGSSVA